jgi:hypothetical protein
MNALYNINIKCIILSSQIELNKKYVLTKSENIWDPIVLQLADGWLPDIEKKLIDEIKNFIFVNELELLPQIISLKIGSEKNCIDIIYGFVVNYTESLNKCFWLEFDFLKEEPYSTLLLETIQKLN